MSCGFHSDFFSVCGDQWGLWEGAAWGPLADHWGRRPCVQARGRDVHRQVSRSRLGQQPLLCHTLPSKFGVPERSHFRTQTRDSIPAPLLMGSWARRPDLRSPPASPSVKWSHRWHVAPGPAPCGLVPRMRLPTSGVHVSPSRPAFRRQGLFCPASLSPAPRLPKCQAMVGERQFPPGHLLRIQAPPDRQHQCS